MATNSKTMFQVALVVVGMALLSILTDYANFRSGWNLLWMVGLPIGVAWVLGRPETWLLKSLWLLVVGWAAMMATAALFHLGP